VGPSPAAPDQRVRDVMTRFETALVSYATRLTGDVEQARDVVQDTFLRWLDKGSDCPDEALGTWLYTTCRRRAFDVRRKEQRMKAREEFAAAGEATVVDGDPSARLIQGERMTGLMQTLGELPERQQEALRLRFQHGMSYRQIGEVMGQTASNVGFLLHQGMNTLRRRLGAAEGVARS